MTDAVAKKHAALVNLLYKRTNARGLNWELNPGRIPQALINDYQVTLYSGSSGGSSVEYVSLNTPFGEEIETFNDESLSDLTPPGFEFEDYYDMMTTTRKKAFRQASGAENAVDEILRQLEHDEDNDI